MARKPLKPKAPITPNSHFVQRRIITKGKKYSLSCSHFFSQLLAHHKKHKGLMPLYNRQSRCNREIQVPGGHEFLHQAGQQSYSNS